MWLQGDPYTDFHSGSDAKKEAFVEERRLLCQVSSAQYLLVARVTWTHKTSNPLQG